MAAAAIATGTTCTAAGTSPTASSSQPTKTELYTDEKWKLSKKELGFSRRSYSTNSSFLIRNSSTSSSSSSSSHNHSKNHSSPSRRRCSFTRKCARLVKEQRARFYIMRRCVTMLICWRDYSDS